MEAKSDPEAPAPRPDATIPFMSTVLSVAFMTVTTIFTAVRVRRDPWALAFVISVYVLVTLFFLCIYIAGRLPVHSPSRKKFKLPIWLLFTALIVLIGYRTSVILSPAFAWPVWVLALFGSSFTFWLLFAYREKPKDCSSGCLSSAEDCTKTKSCEDQTLPRTVDV